MDSIFENEEFEEGEFLVFEDDDEKINQFIEDEKKQLKKDDLYLEDKIKKIENEFYLLPEQEQKNLEGWFNNRLSEKDKQRLAQKKIRDKVEEDLTNKVFDRGLRISTVTYTEPEEVGGFKLMILNNHLSEKLINQKSKASMIEIGQLLSKALIVRDLVGEDNKINFTYFIDPIEEIEEGNTVITNQLAKLIVNQNHPDFDNLYSYSWHFNLNRHLETQPAPGRFGTFNVLAQYYVDQVQVYDFKEM
jgi:hypothetical protein